MKLIANKQHKSNPYLITAENIHVISRFGDIQKMINVIGMEDTAKILNAYHDVSSIPKPINFSSSKVIELGFEYNSSHANSYNKISDIVGIESANKLADSDFLQYQVNLDFKYPNAKVFHRELADWYLKNGN